MNSKIKRNVFLLYGSDFSHHPLQPYHDCRHNYDFTNWQKGLANIFSRVVSYNFVEGFVQHGTGAANSRILEIAAKENPDYVLWPSMTYEIMESTLAALRERSNVVAFFFDDLARFESYSKHYVPYIDYIITCDSPQSVEKYKQVGGSAHFIINAPSGSFFENRHNDDYREDIVFIGNKIADRGVFIDELKRCGLETALYGSGWPVGYISSSKMIELYNTAKINLNFVKTYDNSGSYQFKIRIFEICMCGGFLLTEYLPGIEDYYKIGEEIECFKTKEELVEKVTFYLRSDDKRKQIARAGYEKTKRCFSFENLFAEFFRGIEAGRIKKNNARDIAPDVKAGNRVASAKADWYIRSAYARLMIGKVDQCQQELEIAKTYHPADKRVYALERAIRQCRVRARRILEKNQAGLLRRILAKLKRKLLKY